jgi:hypothetical protein
VTLLTGGTTVKRFPKLVQKPKLEKALPPPGGDGTALVRPLAVLVDFPRALL